MTEHRDLKALIRARMAKTDESFTTARRHILQTRRTAVSSEVSAPWHPLVALGANLGQFSRQTMPINAQPVRYRAVA